WIFDCLRIEASLPKFPQSKIQNQEIQNSPNPPLALQNVLQDMVEGVVRVDEGVASADSQHRVADGGVMLFQVLSIGFEGEAVGGDFDLAGVLAIEEPEVAFKVGIDLHVGEDLEEKHLMPSAAKHPQGRRDLRVHA